MKAAKSLQHDIHESVSMALKAIDIALQTVINMHIFVYLVSRWNLISFSRHLARQAGLGQGSPRQRC